MLRFTDHDPDHLDDPGTLGSLLLADEAGPAPIGDVPLLQVPMACLAGREQACQAWRVDGPLRRERWHEGGSSFALTEGAGHLFIAAETADDVPLEAQSARLYAALLQLLRARGKPHPLRIWNYIAGINRVEGDTERYRAFNSGRRRAFREHGYPEADGAPAACALGKPAGPLQIAVLAGERPPIAIENPRQTSAYHYPRDYGIDPPIFSRAAWLPQAGDGLLLISGTASIVGHQSMHAGDLAAQVRECALNLDAVLEAAQARAGAPRLRLADLQGRVYLRHRGDLPAVRAQLAALGLQRFSYVEGDVCRSELLVEIEAEGRERRAG